MICDSWIGAPQLKDMTATHGTSRELTTIIR